MDLRTLELKISRSENLPVLPEVASAVFRTVDSGSSTPKQIEKLVLNDPALTAKLIRVANSPLYGVANVPTVGRALAVLGMSKTRALLISLVLQQLVQARKQSGKFNQREFWSHSLAVGTAAKILAGYSLPFAADQLYCCGMMHDIGILVMDKFCPDQLDSIISAAEVSGKPLHEAEAAMLPYDHATIGQMLANHWGMDQMTINAIGLHHKPDTATTFKVEANIIYVANLMAHEIGSFNQSPNCTTYQVTDAHLESVGIQPAERDAVLVQISEDLEQVKKTFGPMAA